MDFVNERDEIFDSFKPYYEITKFDELTDPQLLYTLEHTIFEWQIFYQNEIDDFCNVWFSTKEELRNSDHKMLNAILDPAIERFKQKTDDEKETIKKQFTEFRSLYNFLSQIIPYNDSNLEKLFIYLRNLLRKLPRRETQSYDLGEDVALKYYRLQKIAEGSINLKTGENPVIYGPNEVGTGSVDKKVPLSSLITILNDRFGTEFNVADQLFFDQVKETAVANEELQAAAKVNSLENFHDVFNKMIVNLFVERMDGNEEIFIRLMNDEEFKSIASKYLVKQVYEGITNQI